MTEFSFHLFYIITKKTMNYCRGTALFIKCFSKCTAVSPLRASISSFSFYYCTLTANRALFTFQVICFGTVFCFCSLFCFRIGGFLFSLFRFFFCLLYLYRLFYADTAVGGHRSFSFRFHVVSFPRYR